MSTGITRDLSGKLQKRIADVLETELHIFQHVLEPHQLGEVLIEAAVMLARTSAATIAGYGTTDQEVEKLFGSVSASIIDCIRNGEQNGIERTRAALRSRAA